MSIIMLITCNQKKDMQTEWPEMNVSKKETMEWFANAKFGMFIHWGISPTPLVGETSYISQVFRSNPLYRSRPVRSCSGDWPGRFAQSLLMYLFACSDILFSRH